MHFLGRKLLVQSAAAVLAVALMVPCAFALNPSLDISEYAHTFWKVNEEFSKGAVHSLAQTPDGYLWLGTEYGLLRFDGVERVPWPIDESLPSTQIRTLFAARDGTLWLGTSKGLAHMEAGSLHLKTYPELNGQTIFGVAEDRTGNVWAAGWSAPKRAVCSIGRGSVQCYGDDTAMGVLTGALYGDRKENIWVRAANGVWRLSPGPRKFYPLPKEADLDAVAEDDDGALLFALQGAIQRLVDGHVELVHPLPPATRRFRVRRILRDRDGGLWVGTVGRGLVHIHQGKAELFTHTDGLTGDDVTAIFEDREGTIWVGTMNGLDRFRDTPVTTYSEHQGLSSGRIVAVLAAKDGSIWMRTLDGLNRWKDRHVTIYRELNHALSPVAAGHESAPPLSESEFSDQGAGSIYQDFRGRVWVSTPGAVGYFEDDEFVPVATIPGGRVHSIVSDRSGTLWFAHQERGLIRWKDGEAVQQTPWRVFGDSGFADALAADPKDGGLWIGFFRGGLLYFKDGKILKSYTSANGLGEGRINDFRLEADGTLWIATEGGLTRLKDGRLATLTMKNGLPCNRVHWWIEDDLHAVWLYTACGLLQVPRSELDASASAIEKDKNAPVRIQPVVFDSADGLRSRANAGGFSPHVSKSVDGKLWFFPLEGLCSVDPARLPINGPPPAIHIVSLRADRLTNTFPFDPRARLTLPALVRDLEIQYTGIGLAAPEKLRFRYKLESRDRDWTSAGTRRQAFYNDLRPGNYRFRVSASNNGAIWNDAGASLDFTVAPAYYQTTWFASLVAATVLAGLTLLYYLRLRYLKHQFNIRLEARLAERTRIARDLHDTLLQSFQGVLLKFSSLKYMIPSHPTEAVEMLERVMEQARAAVGEGRDAVQGMRSSTLLVNDLAPAISTFVESLTSEDSGQNRPVFRLYVEGKSRDLPPLVRDEVYQIACESLRNAFRHAQARQIEVQIGYDPRQFRLQILDNGKGIDPAVLSAGGRAGHQGLPGLQERAELAGGKLSVWSQLNSGTKIELLIPAAIAYPKSIDRLRKTSRKGS